MAEMKTKSGITVNVIGQAQIGGKHLLIIELPNAQYYHSGDNVLLFKHLVLPLSDFDYDNGIQPVEIVKEGT